jgi:aspartyl aminopeptidase
VARERNTSRVISDLLAFLRDSPTPFHAVASARSRLDAAGFRALRETDAWDARPGGG